MSLRFATSGDRLVELIAVIQGAMLPEVIPVIFVP